MVQITQIIFPFFFPFCSRPSYRARGNRGKVRKCLFRDVSGIAGKALILPFTGANHV